MNSILKENEEEYIRNLDHTNSVVWNFENMCYEHKFDSIKESLLSIIESLNLTSRPYSGRGMNGRECIGIPCDNTSDVIIKLARCSEIPQKFLDNIRFDSLGLRYIVYFPDYDFIS